MIDSTDSVASAYYSYCVQVEENIEAAIVSKIHEIGGDTYEKITLDKNKIVEALEMYSEKDKYIKLPCKVGTKCYAVEMSCSYGWEYRYGKYFPNEHSCNECVKKCDGEYGVYEIVLHTICDIINVKDQIGVSIFFTREEAEQALKEREIK